MNQTLTQGQITEPESRDSVSRFLNWSLEPGNLEPAIAQIKQANSLAETLDNFILLPPRPNRPAQPNLWISPTPVSDGDRLTARRLSLLLGLREAANFYPIGSNEATLAQLPTFIEQQLSNLQNPDLKLEYRVRVLANIPFDPSSTAIAQQSTQFLTELEQSPKPAVQRASLLAQFLTRHVLDSDSKNNPKARALLRSLFSEILGDALSEPLRERTLPPLTQVQALHQLIDVAPLTSEQVPLVQQVSALIPRIDNDLQRAEARLQSAHLFQKFIQPDLAIAELQQVLPFVEVLQTAQSAEDPWEYTAFSGFLTQLSQLNQLDQIRQVAEQTRDSRAYLSLVQYYLFEQQYAQAADLVDQISDPQTKLDAIQSILYFQRDYPNDEPLPQQALVQEAIALADALPGQIVLSDLLVGLSWEDRLRLIESFTAPDRQYRLYLSHNPASAAQQQQKW
ncbi:MAG: lantibiotic dehydratase family protein [Oculatellaceae cyanobacterium Prado106]|jgi:hypothetical protein|nr:lantibiotic dehydratase family protein [Oculatellaceae cyanobacterium Prado106]